MPADLMTGSRRTQAGGGAEVVRRGPGQPDLAPEAVRLAPEAVHLSPEAVPRWRALLESHWRARLERVTELSLAYHDAEEARARAGGGPPARSLLRQAVVERRALAEIEAALARLTSGSFGWCERCGAALPARQLARTPQARYCAGCDRQARRCGVPGRR